eukprot:9286343-Karenia_brevis.AAC.1
MEAASTKLKGTNENMFVINMKNNGKIHRLHISNSEESRERQRAYCGWWAGESVARAFFCKRVVAGNLCRKCFRGCDTQTKGEKLNDSIEDIE